MVILFITSSLEPAKDGVGDYLRVLAAECTRLGHACSLLALNDPFISRPTETAESLGNSTTPILRLPSSLSWEKRVELAREFRTRHGADWISLQFVCYGFHPKGIVRNLDHHLAPIIGNKPLHLMFHETWIGIDQAPLHKNWFVGRIQRHYIRRLVNRLNPRLVTTSNSFYQSLLADTGIPAIEIPLLNNIPICPPSEFDLPEALVRDGICDQHGAHPDRMIGLLFGTLHPDWKVEPFMSTFASIREKTGKRPCLIGAGRLGKAGDILWNHLQQAYSRSMDFVALGQLPARQISTLMQIADFGVNAGWWELLGKSGAATAMLDHGLPVVVTMHGLGRAETPSLQHDPLLCLADCDLEAKLAAGLPRRAPRDRGPMVADQLIHLMLKSTPPV